MMSTKAVHEMLEVGIVSAPSPSQGQGLGVGEVGYLITGVKDVRQSRSATPSPRIATGHRSAGGYKHPNPMVYSGLYPIDGDDYPTCARRSRSCNSTTPR
jgi:GTP-binding protein LepA